MDDRLEFEADAEVLAQLVSSPEAPRSVGVFGARGSGRSTFLRLLAQRIDADDTLQVQHSAWLTSETEARLGTWNAWVSLAAPFVV